MMRFELEVCVDAVSHALAAIAAGATRIEMNCALELDGLTPSVASCEWLKQNCDVPIVAMLRPHDRAFQYESHEEAPMLRDCAALLDAGVDGIVFGALDDAGRIAMPMLQKVRALCGNRQLIFHRAFDRITDQAAALEQLIECGVHRVLTSGGSETVSTGAEAIRHLVQAAGSQIEILPGGGVTAENAGEILFKTGCTQLHGSFRRKLVENAQRNGNLPRGENGPDTAQITQTLQIMRKWFESSTDQRETRG